MSQGFGLPSSPRLNAQPKRRSNISNSASIPSLSNTSQAGASYAHSRRSSHSSLRSIRTVATTFSVNSTATSTSVCSAKFERAYANQAHEWTRTAAGSARRPSLSSQYSATAVRLPPHAIGKRQNLQKQLRVIETLLRETPDLVLTETGSIGWLLAHERHLLKVAIKYDERAQSEWEAAQDWQSSAQEGPVSKIFVTQPSRFGLTPQQHKHRIGQAMTLGNNALDLWRFSDLSYQDAYRIRGAREKLQAEQSGKPELARSASMTGAESCGGSKEKIVKKDFQSWLKDVSKSDALKSVMVKDDGTVDRLEGLRISDDNAAAANPTRPAVIAEETTKVSAAT
ncbi:protein of unknown function [Taphrina deformans PYCC 5710]|uniref:Uncharacterized protein n=1 Tax=Taphrina deformans (strain PYCC 5710 / ATCC 11124 / CBS 356.35 / IMI 108563 / JCM 9778 / NBRC 8474) TaxID=1097556 RepID=R4XDP4_TAPDE|nr:protein of unknown function [Taphrina deformans PYCC 5710]|eukprot:CCG83737.1 protein of unknown function [Taphrina deformans PYCC 5710]